MNRKLVALMFLAGAALAALSVRAEYGDLLYRYPTETTSSPIHAVSDPEILAGLPSDARAFEVQSGEHLEVGIPNALKDRAGHPYTIAMRFKIPANSGKVCLFSLQDKGNPNDRKAMVYLDATNHKVHIRQFDKDKDSGVSEERMAENRWMTLCFSFDEEYTQIFLDGNPLYGDSAILTNCVADCYKAGSNFIIGASDNGFFYFSDFRVYDGARVAADELQGLGRSNYQFVISSAADWALLASNYERGITHGVADPYYLLCDNIDHITQPIGSDDWPFHGHFDGRSNTIEIAITGSDPGTALFPRVSNVTISNLKVNGYVRSTANYAAGLIGMCTGAAETSSVRVDDCTIGVSVGVSGAGYAGGVIGHAGSNNDISLWRVIATGGVHDFSAHAGGLIGWCDGARSMFIGTCLCCEVYGGTGKYHPILCRSEGVSLPYSPEAGENYYVNRYAPTEDAAYVDPHYEGVPVSDSYVPFEWTKVVSELRGFFFYDFYRSAIVTLTPETGDLPLYDGDVLTGTGGPDTHVIVVENSAMVMLRDVIITNIPADADHDWSGITCLYGARIVLAGTNVVKGGYAYAPGIYVSPRYLLNIQGSGTLDASSNGCGAGIGGGWGKSCGAIEIVGGTVIATGGQSAAGIGGGYGSACDYIVVDSGVARVVATHGEGCTNAIGAGASGTCVSLDVADSLQDVTVGATRTITNPSVFVPYAVWAAENNIDAAWNERDALGVHNVFRYAFGRPTGAFVNPALISISFDDEGRAVIHTPPLVQSVTGFYISVLATDDLIGTGVVAYPLDPSGKTVIPASAATARFFRLRATEQ